MWLREASCGSGRLRVAQGGFVQLREASCGSGGLHAAQGGFVWLEEASCSAGRLTELRVTATQYSREVRPVDTSGAKP